MPQNQGVSVYLENLGLFELLKEAGVDIDTRGLRRKPNPKAILPLVPIESLGQVQILADDSYSALMERHLGNPGQARQAFSGNAGIRVNLHLG